MSELIDRIFAALPESEWAGEPLNLWAALRPDVEALGAVSRPPADVTQPASEGRRRAALKGFANRRARAALAAAD